MYPFYFFYIIAITATNAANVINLLLWLPCVADADIIFLPCGFLLLFFSSSPNFSGRRLDVYHTSYMVWP